MVHAAFADIYVEHGDMLTISFRGRKVLMSVKSVVAGGGQIIWGRGGGGQSCLDRYIARLVLQGLAHNPS